MPKRPKPDPASLESPAVSAMQAATGLRIAAVRKLASITQESLAELLNVDQSTVAKWEKGRRMAEPYKMVAFCARFKLTMDFVYRGRLDSLATDLALALAQQFPDLVVVPQPSMALGMGTAQT